jgi:hypothetical protein
VLMERGQLEQAAFVYAELLGDAAAAVALLERDGKLRQAAELAEGRELAPGMVVRLWLLCGESERALLIARRDGAFAQALALLTHSYPEQAARLRLAFADALAQAGDYAGAADVLWPLREAPALLGTFLERASIAGGVQGGRSLARMLALEHEPTRTLARVDELLRDPATEAIGARLGFAEGLLTVFATSAVRRSARAAIRVLLAERARGAASVTGTTLDRLLKLADDAPLRADFPLLPPVLPLLPLTTRKPAIEQRIGARDVGSLAIEDAALLPNGRLLVALGDAGVRLYASDLRTHTHFREPAERLVLNPQGTRALALAKRGRLYRIARLELTQRRAESWCDVELDCFASSFDGSRWFVLRDRDLLALDAAADDVRALLRVPAVASSGGPGLDVVCSGRELELLIPVRESESCDYFAYELDPLVLRKRHPAASPARAPVGVYGSRLRPGAHGAVVHLGLHPADQRPHTHVLFWGKHAVPIGRFVNGSMQEQLEVTKSWAAVAIPTDDGALVALVNLDTGDCVLRVALEGKCRVRLRLDAERLLIADDRGRVRVIALDDGQIQRDARLHA